METKKPWQSKTIVLNAVGGLLVFVGMFWPGASSVTDWIAQNGATIAIAWNALNIALRFATKGKIELYE